MAEAITSKFSVPIQKARSTIGRREGVVGHLGRLCRDQRAGAWITAWWPACDLRAVPCILPEGWTFEILVLKNVPRLADVTMLGRILGNHGVDITAVGKKVGQSTIDGETFKLKAAEIVDTTAPYEMVSRMMQTG